MGPRLPGAHSAITDFPRIDNDLLAQTQAPPPAQPSHTGRPRGGRGGRRAAADSLPAAGRRAGLGGWGWGVGCGVAQKREELKRVQDQVVAQVHQRGQHSLEVHGSPPVREARLCGRHLCMAYGR